MKLSLLCPLYAQSVTLRSMRLVLHVGTGAQQLLLKTEVLLAFSTFLEHLSLRFVLLSGSEGSKRPFPSRFVFSNR